MGNNVLLPQDSLRASASSAPSAVVKTIRKNSTAEDAEDAEAPRVGAFEQATHKYTIAEIRKLETRTELCDFAFPHFRISLCASLSVE